MHSNVSRENLIAIIDDEQSIRNGLSSLLRSEGYETVLFSSAESFLSSEKINNIKFMVLDLKLTEMSGVTLFELLLEANIKIPTVFISGNAEPEMSESLVKKGGILFLSKPINVELLLRKVKDILAG
ncbi:response regulator transcription factor [Shewanella ulleungensis]|uniref:Response regulator n=1 Tax=Shewanella ulleungensis TaxID=2282699 RepID=A0ABQ2QD52_9GAMM|nr:response regulator [Shewanella ulleungensis]MCL1148848.1 response regulator [Shewanella ulleungensis]GGP75236.1 response regulator [Shewanella ulleungensis]